MKESLRNRLLRYLKANHGFVASGDLQRLVMTHTNNTARTAVRRLEELAEEGKLEVQYRTHNGVRHAFYRAFEKENTSALIKSQILFFEEDAKQ